ncbi:hypothetical protein A2U01_0049778, partial [Trifolium medium]|nr:hypothetical protein [Trifolium medium]
MNNVSSAYCKCEMETSPSFTTNGLKNPNSTALVIREPSPSTTNKNKNGAKGSPCFSPLLMLTSCVGLPLINTEKFPANTQAFIQHIHFLPKLNL